MLLSGAESTVAEKRITLSVLRREDALCIIPTVLHVLHMQRGLRFKEKNFILSKFNKLKKLQSVNFFHKDKILTCCSVFYFFNFV